MVGLHTPSTLGHGCTSALNVCSSVTGKAQWGPVAPDMGAYQTILLEACEGFHILCLPGSPLSAGVPTGQVCMSAQGPGSTNLGFPNQPHSNPAWQKVFRLAEVEYMCPLYARDCARH